jgi:hypothetical protein
MMDTTSKEPRSCVNEGSDTTAAGSVKVFIQCIEITRRNDNLDAISDLRNKFKQE